MEFFIEKKQKQVKDIKSTNKVEKVIKSFLELTNSKEKATTAVKNRIKELLKEFSVEDLEDVAFYFNKKWREDPKFSKHITMKTLFNNKFESRFYESEDFKISYKKSLDLINSISTRFSNYVEFTQFNEVSFELLEKIIFWNKRFSSEEILETIDKTIEDWNKNPKIAKYTSVSKILDRKFPERVSIVKKQINDSIHKSGITEAEEWLQKTKESDIIDTEFAELLALK